MSEYWVDDDHGCPIGGPFDLWRKNYFLFYGKPPEDTCKMYPALSVEVIKGIAIAAATHGAELDVVLDTYRDSGPIEQLTMAYEYFHEWRKHAPFMPDFFQDCPLRPARTSHETIDEFLEDNRRVHNIGGSE